MHWRTEKALLMLLNIVQKYNGIHFSYNVLKSEFVFEVGDWHKHSKPLLDSFITLGLLEVIHNDIGRICGYTVNLERIKEKGIKIDPETMELYFSIMRDAKEKSDHETRQDIAKLKMAEPEVKR